MIVHVTVSNITCFVSQILTRTLAVISSRCADPTLAARNMAADDMMTSLCKPTRPTCIEPVTPCRKTVQCVNRANANDEEKVLP